jgi:hypothetical protein
VLRRFYNQEIPMTIDRQDDSPPMPMVSMDPLTLVPTLAKGGHPLAAPIKGSIDRPDFRNVAPLREIVPTSVPPLDTLGQLQRDQERRDRQATDERERLAALPTPDEVRDRRIAVLEADVADLRVRLARLEGPTRMRGRAPTPARHRGNDEPGPEAA